jgi:predicted CoA-binding protein
VKEREKRGHPIPMVTATTSPVEVLRKAKTIAVVGASRDPEKDAHSVPLYLRTHGYRIVPVNPNAAEAIGEKAYPSLGDIPESITKAIDVVEVFRPSEELPRVAKEVAEMMKRTKKHIVFWAQLGLYNGEAEKILQANGVDYVMDACMRIVHQTYLRETASGARRA